MTLARLLLLLVALLVAVPAAAQFTQYIPPGSLGEEKLPRKEALETAMEQAPWHAGPVRLAPWVGLKNFGYVDNVFSSAEAPKSDVTATAGFGLQGYLHPGPKVILAAYALPEYEWWADLSERRGWHGEFGAGFFGYFNRLRVEVEAGTYERQDFASGEYEGPVTVSRDRGAAQVEVELLKRVSLVGEMFRDDYRYDEEDVSGPAGARLLQLDRDEEHGRFGVRYRFSSRLMLGAGYETTRADFLRPENDRSNTGDAVLAELRFDGNHFAVAAEVAARTIDPRPGSAFVPFDGETGRATLTWNQRGRVPLRVYGARYLAYSVYVDEAPYYVDERLGASIGTKLGWRIDARAFAEAGANDYAAAAGAQGSRRDDLTLYGLAFRVKLWKASELAVTVSNTDYDSNTPGNDRSVFRVQTSLNVGQRLSQWW